MVKGKEKTKVWETLLCALSYLFPVWVFGLFFANRSGRIRFHVCDAVNLSLTTLLYLLLAAALGFGMNLVSWRWSDVSIWLYRIVWALYLLLAVLGAVRAVRSRSRPLPLVIRFARLR